MLKKLLYSIFFCFSFFANAQDTKYAKQVVKELCSPYYSGRGYINYGQKRAATYISNQFDSLGVKKIGGNYFQTFTHSVNTIEKAFVAFDNDTLTVGEDFLVAPYSCSINNSFKVVNADLSKDFGFFRKARFKNKILNLKTQTTQEVNYTNRKKYGFAGILTFTKSKLTASVSQNQFKFPSLQYHSDSISSIPERITLDVNARYYENYKSNNVIAQIKGTEKPDSFIVFTAHYDHLGMQGSAMFAGANDNASGVAMLLNLAKYYKVHPPKYTVVFIAFAAEELGLLGSKYFVENPLIDLPKIKVLINMDLVGTGEEGAAIVNGLNNPLAEKLARINKQYKYIKGIQIRGNAANSDHYFFAKQGVNAMFLYLKGGSQAYHDIYDTPEKLSYFSFNNLVQLLVNFSKEF